MRKKRQMLLGIVLGLLAAALGVGFHFFRQHQAFEAEMVRAVHSQEVKEQIENSLRKKDPAALMENGKIRSYKIDDKGICHNPMGGIMFRISINDNPSMVIQYGLRKYGEDEPVTLIGVSYTEELQQFLEEPE